MNKITNNVGSSPITTPSNSPVIKAEERVDSYYTPVIIHMNIIKVPAPSEPAIMHHLHSAAISE